MPEMVSFTLGQAILAVAISDITLAFDNALANSQMAMGLPRRQQKTAIFFGLLLSCGIMILLTFTVVQLRATVDWIRYPAAIWLLVIVYKMWFGKVKERAPHEVGRAVLHAILLITFNDLTLMADNAIANSEFALRAGREQLWTVLVFGLLISCMFMIMCTYAIVWIRRYIDWIRYPAGAWLLWVAWLIASGAKPGG